tara:strand:+ start:8 stop:433 length:426 start_codon:yes stop_codon:yes gene_type:complete
MNLFSKKNSYILYYLSKFFPKEICFYIYNIKKNLEIETSREFYLENTTIKIIKIKHWDLIEDYSLRWYNKEKTIFTNKNSNDITNHNYKYLENILYKIRYNTMLLQNKNMEISKLILNEINHRNHMLHIIEKYKNNLINKI